MSTNRLGGDVVPDEQSGFTTVTIQVMQNVPVHALSTVEATAARLSRGDIIDLFKTDQHATQDGQNWRWNTPILHPTCVFIHMRGVKQENTGKMRRRFREDLTGNNIGRLDETTDVDVARKRRWFVVMENLPQRVKDELRDFKEATIAWDNIKGDIRRKVYTVIEDPGADDVSNPIDDSDIPEGPAESL